MELRDEESVIEVLFLFFYLSCRPPPRTPAALAGVGDVKEFQYRNLVPFLSEFVIGYQSMRKSVLDACDARRDPALCRSIFPKRQILQKKLEIQGSPGTREKEHTSMDMHVTTSP